MRASRWSDNDSYFGPFTWAWGSTYRPIALVLRSRGDDDEDSGVCTLRISVGKATLIVVLPGIVQPWRRKVFPVSWDADTVKRLGRNWYWDIDPRQYGFSLHEGHLSVYYGRTGGACMNSSIQQQWGYFLPWTQWRHVRHSLYGLRGEHIWTEPKGADWDARRKAEETCPSVAFAFKDFDGEELIATTRIEEREWRFGTGWFRWLSLFRRPKVRRSLGINFSGETGTEKGSWKGGTIGTGIDMLPGELHEAAFRRCYISRTQPLGVDVR